MNDDESQEAMTFGEVYRRAREAGMQDGSPFDLQRGLNELRAWMDRKVVIIAKESAPPSPQVELRGRHELLDTLLTLANRPEDGPAVLAGMGGAGKTTVTAALAEHLRGQGRLVWWANASHPTELSATLVTVARQLGGSPRDLKAITQGETDAPDRLWRLLEGATRHWLLVLDNVDDPRALAVGALPAGVQDHTGWVRPSRRGLVVVTSRETDPRMWGAARLYPVSQLDETDAAQVLRDLAPQAGDEDHARLLARQLDGLPLALHLAGTYLRSELAQWSTFSEYVAALEQDGARSSVARAAEISLAGLALHGIPQARAVLRLTSCYASASIPTGMLESRSAAGLFGQPRDSRQLMSEALRGLRSVGLIENWRADSAETINIHPVVTDAHRRQLDESEPESVLIRQTAIDVLATATQKLRYDLPANWPRFRLLGQHLLTLLTTAAEHVDREHLVTLLTTAASTARAFSRSGASKAAQTLCQLALEHCSTVGDTHLAALHVRHQLAWTTADQGDLDGAETMYHDILDLRLGMLGNHAPDTLDSRHELAWITASQGRWSAAESLYQQTLDDGRHTVGPDNPRTLTTRHELAWAIASQGRIDEAGAAFQQVLRDRKRILGDDHPQTLATSHEVAWVAAKQGKWAEAEAIYRQVLERRQQTLETDHPHTLVTAHELAWTTARQDRWDEAKARYEDVLRRRRRALGNDHPDTQKTLHALTELRNGRIVDANHLT